MSNKDEALKLALEALEEINRLSIGKNAICLPAEIDTAMDALREALAEQPAQQEPVAYIRKDQLQKAAQSPMLCEVTPEPRQDRIGIHTSPPASKPWVGLDETDLAVCDTDCVRLARYWERVLREKNA